MPAIKRTIVRRMLRAGRHALALLTLSLLLPGCATPDYPERHLELRHGVVILVDGPGAPAVERRLPTVRPQPRPTWWSGYQLVAWRALLAEAYDPKSLDP
jgi:hypothetical protein